MSDQNDSTNLNAPHLRPLLELWASYTRQAHEVTQTMLGNLDESDDPEERRQQWTNALGDSADLYLRSPWFLQMMRAHIDLLTRAPRASTAAADNPESIADRVQKLEQIIRTHLEQLEQHVAPPESRTAAPAAASGWESDSVTSAARTDAAQTQGATPHEIVYTQGTLKLLRYRSESIKFVEPVVICYALVNRPYILDLHAERSMVRRLRDAGFDVYLIDWGVPTETDQRLHLHDYVCRFLKDVVRVVSERSCSPKVNLLGYCMGGTMSAMFTAMYPQLVHNLILLATPIDFSGDEGLLNVWSRQEVFDVDKLVDAYGNCPGEFLKSCFQLLKPVQNFVEKYATLSERLDDAAFVENFWAMEQWANDSIPVAGETFREFVKWLYQQNQLVKGDLQLDGAPVTLDAVTCPLLLLVAQRDHLVPPGSTRAIESYVRSREIETMSINAGHIGLAVSSKAHRDLWPRAANWIGERSTQKT